jgi:hypothetical protein
MQRPVRASHSDTVLSPEHVQMLLENGCEGRERANERARGREREGEGERQGERERVREEGRWRWGGRERGRKTGASLVAVREWRG